MASHTLAEMQLTDGGNKTQNLQLIQEEDLLKYAEYVKQTIPKPTTIDLVGGIHCHICKETYSKKKEYDHHYAEHGTGEKVVYTCVVCLKQHNSYPSLRGHCYTTHVIHRRHRCECCSKYFSKFTALKEHIKTFHTFICSKCNKQFTSKNELQLHQVIHTNSLPYHCQVCEVQLGTLDSCKDHVDTHTVLIYTCPICNENIADKNNASEHLKKHFNNTVEESTVQVVQYPDDQETSVERLGGIACGYCPDVFKNRVEFDEHFSYHHGDKDIVYICTACDKQYDKYSALAQHAYNHVSKDRFCCDICQKTYDRLSLLVTHMAVCQADSQASGKPFACHECGHRYCTEQRLRQHLRGEHGVTCIRCPLEDCQKKFSTLKQLILHQYVHNAQQNWCRQCGMPFNSLTACERHLDVHKRKLYCCPICNKNYKQKYVILNHLTQHFESILHICKVCGKVYNKRRCFMDHIKTHDEKRVHHCTYCDKGFGKLDQLQQHLNVHTGSKPFKCSICSKTFASYPNWAKHKRRMHNLDGQMPTNNDPTSDDEDNEVDKKEGVNEDEFTKNYGKNNNDDSNLHISPNSNESFTETNHIQTIPQTEESDMKLQYGYYKYNNNDSNVHSSESNESFTGTNHIETIPQIEKSDMKLQYGFQVQDSTMEPETIDRIDIEKELQIMEGIQEKQTDDTFEMANVLEAETIFVNAIPEVPHSTGGPFTEATNYPPEYGPEFTIGESCGILDLDDHMLPHIDPLLTIKTGDFNMTQNLLFPNMDAAVYQEYQVTQKWEPPVFTKVCPEYAYYGDMVDSNRVSMMNTDIF